MEHINLHSLLFMPRQERNREIAKIERFDDIVTESNTLSISSDYGSKEIYYKREDLIKEVVGMGTDVGERVKLKKAMEGALAKELDDDRCDNLFKTLNFLDCDKACQLSDILLKIHKVRYKSDNYSPKESKDIERTFALCDILDDCIRIFKEDLYAKDLLGYLRQAAITINDVAKNRETNIYKYLVTLKLAVLFDYVNKAPDEIKQVFNNAGSFDTCDLVELSRLKLIPGSGHLASHLNGIKNEIENELDIILADYEIKPHNSISGSPFKSSDSFQVIPTVISHLRGGSLSVDRLYEMYVGKKRDYTVKLNTSDLFKFKVGFPSYSTERCTSVEGDEVWLATDYINLNILLKDVNTGDLLYVRLVENCRIKEELDVLLGNDNIPTGNMYVNRIKFKSPSNIDLATVTEGIKFTEDGGVKLTYKPVSTYMDDYSRINRVLVLNARNGNIEGMKTDLVYLFSFINELEKITKGKVRVKEGVHKDAEKARMFAIGDFKQYLAIVQEADPMFNFSKYFEENYKDTDKVLIEFSNSEIKGFKKLLRTILG